MAKIFNHIEGEIRDFIDGQVQISPGYYFSQYKTVKRISLYLNGKYASGNIDSQGNYKYWYDIITPRINSEIKNIDFDTKDITLESDSDKDDLALIIANARLKQWLREKDQSEALNDSVEDGSSWGNVVWKKVKDGYEQCDLINFFVINPTARTLDDTAAIERHILTQSQLRAKKGIWDDEAIENVIKGCADYGFATTEDGVATNNKKTPYYEIYERNGEISLAELHEAQGKAYDFTKEDKYVLAKVVVAGIKHNNSAKEGDRYVLFAEEIPEMPYKEYHRGKYQGRWLRLGIAETLFDIQTRANETGNQIARALEYGAKQVYQSPDELIYKNLLTDLKRGDIIRTTQLQRVDMKMDDIMNYVNEWNMLMALADKLCNSFEVVTGESSPSGTPFRLAAQQNQNANKLFDFFREKLGIAIKGVFQDWILPDLLKDLKKRDILKITNDPDSFKRVNEYAVKSWYTNNLLAIGPHTAEQASMLMKAKMQELMVDEEACVKLYKELWDNFKPRVSVVIVGENTNKVEELQTLATFIQMEGDPVRRTALIEMVMAKKGIDVAKLPKTPPQPQIQPQTAPVGQGQSAINAMGQRGDQSV